jgi:hypothetical protein
MSRAARLVATAALTAALVAGSATVADAAEFLTAREAKTQTRIHLRKADPAGEVYFREVAPCWRIRRHIVDCEFYEEGTDEFGDYVCDGTVRVREFRTFYRTRGMGVDCR